GTTGATAPAPALSAFNWFPKKSASTIESNPELRPQKLVALGETPASFGVSPKESGVPRAFLPKNKLQSIINDKFSMANSRFRIHGWPGGSH
ncbi:MAG: hypothetical protein ACLQVY_12745, partial [Limisphaerales bacterium]